MFKKSEEQEWSRFRGALSKDRDDTVSAPAVTVDANDAGAAGQPTPPAGNATSTATAGSSFRTIQDVNVGLPTARLSRSAGTDGSDVETLIGERTHFEGTLRAEGAVRLLGTVDGEIQSSGTIIVEEKAHVTARLTASQVTIAGQVDGQIYCDGRVEIRPTGRVTGEISAGALIVQEGAYFDGNSRMAPPPSAGGGSGAAGSGAAGSHGPGSGSAGSGAGSGAGAGAAGHAASGSGSGSSSAGAGGSSRGGSAPSSSDGAATRSSP